MASLLIELFNGDEVDIQFNIDGPIKYWKPTSQGILVKRYDNSRTTYPWTSIKSYTVFPSNYQEETDEE